mgnify:CR=1 FL=1
MEKIDSLDKKILEIISNNARIPFKDVAAKCGVSRAAIHQRVQRLIDMNVIVGSGYHVNPASLGYNTSTYIGITLEKGSMYNSVVKEFTKIPEIVECHYTTGPYTMLIKLYAKDNAHLMELLNEKLWVDVLDAGADGIALKTGELLTKYEIYNGMAGKRNVFNQPVLEKIVERFREAVTRESLRQSSIIQFEIDRYDECFLRHLALGYTKEMISSLKTMPFGVKSLEKRQADLVCRLFPEGEQRGINVTRLVVRSIELRIIDPEKLVADE